MKPYDLSFFDPREESEGDITNPRTTTVVIEILNNPTIRLVRNVTFSLLDFVVSIGGIVGLFFGASILGLFEIIYIWMMRKF